MDVNGRVAERQNLRHVFFDGMKDERRKNKTKIFSKREQQNKPKPYGVDFVENFFSWKALRSQFFRYTDLQPAVFPFPPQLFQVEGQSEQK